MDDGTIDGVNRTARKKLARGRRKEFREHGDTSVCGQSPV